jgi:hypothetical protein
VATALKFHLNLADHLERALFLKDLAIAGGLFVPSVTKPIDVSISAKMFGRS